MFHGFITFLRLVDRVIIVRVIMGPSDGAAARSTYAFSLFYVFNADRSINSGPYGYCSNSNGRNEPQFKRSSARQVVYGSLLDYDRVSRRKQP